MAARSPTMVMLHIWFVECRWWHDGWTEDCRHLTVVGLHDPGPWTLIRPQLPVLLFFCSVVLRGPRCLSMWAIQHRFRVSQAHSLVRECRQIRSFCVAWLPSVVRSGNSAQLLKPQYRLSGLVVKASASRVQDPGFESRLRMDFSGVESYQ